MLFRRLVDRCTVLCRVVTVHVTMTTPYMTIHRYYLREWKPQGRASYRRSCESSKLPKWRYWGAPQLRKPQQAERQRKRDNPTVNDDSKAGEKLNGSHGSARDRKVELISVRSLDGPCHMYKTTQLVLVEPVSSTQSTAHIVH